MSFTVGCFGYGGNVALVEVFYEELVLNDIQLKTCHEYPNASVPYDKDKIFDFIDSCDIILLPSRTKIQPAKSVNRLSLALSRRKACVVSPLNAYVKYFKHGEHILIAETKEQWLEAILKLRDDAELRNRLAQNGFSANLQLHPINHIGKLINELNYYYPLENYPDTLVQVIIPHYAPRLDYLELTVKAVAESVGPLRDILIISSSKVNPNQSTLLRQYKNVRIIHSEDRKSFSQANNIGIQHAHEKTTHYLLLNDDTILSKTSLRAMVKLILNKGDNFILNPKSNCDKGWLHNDSFSLGTKQLIPNMKIEEFTSDELKLLFDMGTEPFSGLLDAPFCAFYCTLIPKKIVDVVGTLNTLFKNGGEDLDYCERAKRFGFKSYWTKEAFCFHFGGKTRAVSEKENYDQHHIEDKENNIRVRKRWPSNKKRIAIWTGPAWETWDIDSYKTTGIGGSETCAARLAQTAAEEGHSVTLYGAHDLKEQYGVQLMPWNTFQPEEEYFDLFIASRNINCIDQRLRAKRILVWCHDIWLLSGKEISEYHRNRVDKFVCLSPWHEGFFCDHHQVSKDRITIIPNGINVELFDKYDMGKKKYGKLIYSSSPDRGLDNLMYIMSFAKEQIPELHLDVYYGFHNYESAVRQRGSADEVRRLNDLKADIEKYNSFVHMHGRISQPELARRWSEAYAWIQPTLFTETFCCLANTKISMSDGTYKQIIDIKEGDEVKTHAGVGKVLKTMNRSVAENIYKIKIKNLKDPLEVTSNHPIYALTESDNKCIRFGRFCKKTYVGCTYYTYQDKKNIKHTITENCRKYTESFNPCWVEAKDLNKGDFVCILKNKNSNEPPLFSDVLKISNFDYRKSFTEEHHAINCIEDFHIDEEFLEFCGWYLAEGVFDGRSILSFSLNIEEEKEADLIKKQITRIGLKYREDMHPEMHTRVVITHSVILGQFFASFGRISKDRRIPQWIKDLDIYYLQYFLRGYYHGDGSERLNSAIAEGASNDLVYDLFEIFVKFNCVSYTANTKKKKPIRKGNIIVHSNTEKVPAFLIGTSMSQNKELFKFFGYSPDENGIEKSFIEDDNYVYLPITKIETYKYEGDVYNFEVEGDNSYIANGIVVHNCITAKEAQLSGTPIVCSNIAALQTTVGEYGHLVNHHPYSYEGRMEYLDQIIKLHKEKDHWLELSKRSLAGAVNISWGDRWRDYWSKWL